MKTKVIPGRGLTVASGPRVVLDMSIEEFAMYESLRYQALSGQHVLRDAITDAHDEVLTALPDPWKTKVRSARWSGRGDASKVAYFMRRRGA